MKSEDPDELRIARQANMWLIRLKSEGSACHQPFTVWLLESSRHVKAYLMASAMSARLGGLDPQHEIDVDALISQANNRVVPLTLDQTDETETFCEADREDPRRLQPKRRKRWRQGVAAVFVAAAVVFLVGVPITRSAETFATEVGQQLRVQLEDGSLVYLNTNSQVQIRYTPVARDIQLLRGEALFTVEHDTRRPFRVSTGTAVVQALGTQFDVYRQPARTLIEVVKGEVDVQSQGNEGSALPQRAHIDPYAPTPAIPEPAHLITGERASVDLEGQIRRDARNVQLAQDWQQRQLVFDNAPLAEVAAEINRYNRAQIVVEGKDLGARPISGTFSADHPQALVLFLQKRDERVVVDNQRDEFVIRYRPRD